LYVNIFLPQDVELVRGGIKQGYWEREPGAVGLSYTMQIFVI